MTMQVKKPESFDFFGNTVFNCDELKLFDPNFFFGCSRGIRTIITKKNISENEYFFGYITKSGWKKCSDSYPKGKLLLKSEWVENNIPKFAIDKNINYDIEPAPPILELEDHEKFIDENKKILNIEVRGERCYDKCYFKLKDVSKEFKLDNLQSVIQHKDNGYKIDIHYKSFYITNNDQNEKYLNQDKQTLTKGTTKKLFLTYAGLIKVLFTSRNKNIEKFQNFVIKNMFIFQLGNNEDKELIVADILGVNIKVIKEVFQKSATSIPCIYLFTLNTVKELRDILKIPEEFPDNAIVCKYGKTNNLERRTKEHQLDYGKMKNVNLKLKLYSYIDPLYVYDAESEIRNFFNNNKMKFNLDNRNEIVIIDSTIMNQVKKEYNKISVLYSGHSTELIQKLNNLEIEREKDKNNYQLEKEKDRCDYELKLKIKQIESMEQIDILKTEQIKYIKQIESLKDQLLIYQNKIYN